MGGVRPLAVVLALVGSAAGGVSPLPSEGPERELILQWRARLDELAKLERDFRGSVGGASTTDLGRVAFIFEEAYGAARVDEYDREFVRAAVRGQTADELEQNLPAIVNYVKLSAAAGPMLASAVSRRPALGARRGLATVMRLGKTVIEVRSRQRVRVRAGQIPAAYVLTKTNLGQLGHRTTLREFLRAYREGEFHILRLNDLLAFLSFFGTLAAMVAVTLALLRLTDPASRLVSLGAPKPSQ
jgi:hypothetical protein